MTASRLPKLALYQAELRPDLWKVAEFLGEANNRRSMGIARNRPVPSSKSRTSPELVRG